MHQILHPTSETQGVPDENAFLVLDEAGLKLGSATVVEFINEAVLTDRPLNYYVNVSAVEPRAFDMLVGAVLARSKMLRQMFPDLAARIYIPCRPNDTSFLRSLQAFGFQNDDAEIRMRKILNASERIPMPPVGCEIAPVVLEDEEDAQSFLKRVNQYSVTSKSMRWLSRMYDEQLFTVYGCWQEKRLLGELVLTGYGTEGRVEFVYTRPEYRNRGVAVSLIAHASDVLLREHYRTISAEVWRRNEKAISLFQTMHFDSISPVILYPGINL